MLEVWHITTARLVPTAFDGTGARLYGGRWSAKGVPVVYTAAHLSLAVLEMLAQGWWPRANYVAIPAQIPYDVAITRLSVQQLPPDWSESSGIAALRLLGVNWLATKETAVLEVPSAVLPQESVYLLNPAHANFGRITMGAPSAFGA